MCPLAFLEASAAALDIRNHLRRRFRPLSRFFPPLISVAPISAATIPRLVRSPRPWRFTGQRDSRVVSLCRPLLPSPRITRSPRSQTILSACYTRGLANLFREIRGKKHAWPSLAGLWRYKVKPLARCRPLPLAFWPYLRSMNYLAAVGASSSGVKPAGPAQIEFVLP